MIEQWKIILLFFSEIIDFLKRYTSFGKWFEILHTFDGFLSEHRNPI